MKKAAEEYVYAMLPGGWEINDGSFGTAKITLDGAEFDHKDREMTEVPHPFGDVFDPVPEGGVMAHPWHHSISSAKKWGGTPEDYAPIHNWFDHTKELVPDIRHRAARHHAEGIFVCEQVFGITITVAGRAIPVRWIAEQHVKEDLGFIPTLQDWLRNLDIQPWMGGTPKLAAEVEAMEVPK